MSKRLDYIDIAKGIGILLVVMGHNDFYQVSPFLYKLIYSFHVPLFFFLSGMFFNPDQTFLHLAKRRFNTILKPYIATILLIYFMTLSFTKVSLGIASSRVIKAIYANGHYIDWGQLWFLPHLFALNIFAFLFYKTVKLFHNNLIKLTLLFILLFLGAMYINIFWPFSLTLLNRTISLYGLPFSIDLIFVSGFFFILGREINLPRTPQILSRPIILFASLGCLLAMIYLFPYSIDLDARTYQSLPVNTIEALIGILFVLSLSIQIEHLPKLSIIFRYIGKASLFLLLFHLPIQEAWGEKIMDLTNNQNLAYWSSYVIGVISPLLIYQFTINPNPIVRTWFGQAETTHDNMKTDSSEILEKSDDLLPG